MAQKIEKCDRCGVEFANRVKTVPARDGGFAHENPLECIAYNLQKLWLTGSLTMKAMIEIQGSMDDYLNGGEEDEQV